MIITDEINRRLSRCAQRTTTPQQKENIRELTRYVENVARRRLEDLIAFVDAVDALWEDHPIRRLEITQQTQAEYADLYYAVHSADGFLTTYGESS